MEVSLLYQQLTNAWFVKLNHHGDCNQKMLGKSIVQNWKQMGPALIWLPSWQKEVHIMLHINSWTTQNLIWKKNWIWLALSNYVAKFLINKARQGWTWQIGRTMEFINAPIWAQSNRKYWTWCQFWFQIWD